MASWVPWVVAGVSAFALIDAALYARKVLKADPGSERMQRVSASIREAAMAFISREYIYVSLFLAFMFLLICVALRSQGGWMAALCYLLGASFSLLAGYAGVAVATRANARTAQAAIKGEAGSLSVAFSSGAVMGLTVAGLGLLGLTICYLIFEVALGLSNSISIIIGYSLGASTVGLFARVAGGIFTEAGDVGAHLVQAQNEPMPDDLLQNPALVTLRAGDYVGEVAGMGADLYESYIAAIIAPIAISATGIVFKKLSTGGMILPLAITGAGLACCILGALFVRTKKEGGRAVQRAMTWPVYGSAALATVSSFLLIWAILKWNNIGLFYSVMMGILAGLVIALTAEYFTSSHYSPVRSIALGAGSSGAIAILQGFIFGLLSVAMPILIVAAAITVSFITANRVIPGGGGIYGIGLSALGMLSITGIIAAVDAAGPVASNALDIASDSRLDQRAIDVTRDLASAGNTTAAISKGFAIGAAALAAIALLAAYSQVTGLSRIFLISNYKFIVGMLLGALVPFVFSALTLKAVLRAAFVVLEETKRQFRDILGLAEGAEGVVADSRRCSDMTAKVSVYQMLLPGGLAVAAPLVVGLLLGKESLAGFLAGALVAGFILATMMANTGTAWANARKFIESGSPGEEEESTREAILIADTVGNPFRNTSSPAMNILINVMSMVSLLFVPLFIH